MAQSWFNTGTRAEFVAVPSTSKYVGLGTPISRAEKVAPLQAAPVSCPKCYTVLCKQGLDFT